MKRLALAAALCLAAFGAQAGGEFNPATGTPGSGTVTSVGLGVPASSLFGATGTPVTTSGTLGLTTTGTSGGVPYFFDASTLKTSGALTINLPVFGGGAGAAPFSGTRSGNTTAVVTTTGAQTSGDCVKIDASGNHIANGSACGGSGTVSSVTLAPGFAKTVGTQNTGSDAITSTGTINGQLWPVTKTSGSPYTVATADTGVLLIAGAASYTFTLPNAAAGTKGTVYQFGSDGTFGFTLTTAGGAQTIYGCPGGGGTSLVEPLNVDVFVTDDGTNYKCTAVTSPIIPVALTYAPGVDLTSMPISNIYAGRIIVGIRCTPEVVSGGAATLQPVKAASATLIASGTNLTSNTCNVNTGAATDQNLTVSVTTLAAGDRLGVIGSGASITSANTLAKGLITVFLR